MLGTNMLTDVVSISPALLLPEVAAAAKRKPGIVLLSCLCGMVEQG